MAKILILLILIAVFAGCREDCNLSGGGMAHIPLAGVSKEAETLVYDQARFGPQPSPRAALKTYLEVLRERIKDPNLGLYTRGSRKFFRIHLVTDRQQSQEWAALSGAIADAEEIVDGKFAVVKFPQQQKIPPYLMERSQKGWMLDLAAMGRLIGFDHRNEWFFRKTEHQWMFAFGETASGRNGTQEKSR